MKIIPNHSDIEKIKEQESIIRLAVLTGGGAVIQIFFIALEMWQLTSISTKDFSTFQPQFTLLITYFLLTLFYCIPLSFSFRPKRIVSPFYIQIITAIMFMIILSTYLIMGSVAYTPEGLKNVVSTGLLISMLMVFAGLAQLEIVKRITGLNGTIDDLNVRTYYLNTNYEMIYSEMKKSTFLNLAEFKIEQDNASGLVLKSLEKTNEKLIIFLAKDPNDNYKAILSTISYQSKWYSITRSDFAKEAMREKIAYLKQKFDEIGKQLEIIKEDESPTDIISLQAISFALKTTQSKLSSFSELPRYYLFVSIFIGIVGAIMTWSYIFNGLGDDLFIGTIVVLIVESLMVFVPMIRESRKITPILS